MLSPDRHRNDGRRRRRRSSACAFAAASFFAAAAGAQDVAGAETAYYVGARLITGDGTVVENSTFAVANGRFTNVGPNGQVEIPADARRIDLDGYTVMPAIVDAHVHLSDSRDARIVDLRQRAHFGVGTTISMGSDVADESVAVCRQVLPGAARCLSAGSGITRPEPGRREVHWIDTADQAREAVQQEQARGVDMIKIWVDDRDGRYDKLTPELYGAVIDEAHRLGLRVAAHIFALDDAKGLLRAGIDIFAHGVRDRDVDEEFLELVAAHPGVILIANLPDRGVATDMSWAAGAISDEELNSLQQGSDDSGVHESFGIQARNLARLDEAGMTIAMGTDGNRPWGPHVEMEDMVAAGMSPAGVIEAATSSAAAALGLDDVGTIAPGQIADFIVLEDNPLDDIRNTRAIAAVYLRGEPVD